MGDADNTPVSLSVQEIEEWMDDALNEMDDGMSRLFSFMSNLNDRIAYIMSEIAVWQNFRLCFTALNVFVIPVLVAIGIAYGTTGVVEQNSTMEDALQTMIMILMYLSGCIGFPLYVYTLWQAYFTEDAMERAFTKSTRSHIANSEWENDGDTIVADDDVPLSENSVEMLSEIGRMFNRRIRDNVRLELARRVSLAEEEDRTNSETPVISRSREILEAYDNEDTMVTNERLLDLDSTPLPDRASVLSEIIHNEMFERQDSESCGVKVIILNTTPDLSVEIESEVDALETRAEENKEKLDNPDDDELIDLTDTVHPSGIRDIKIENFAEGDSRLTSLSLKTDNAFRFADGNCADEGFTLEHRND